MPANRECTVFGTVLCAGLVAIGGGGLLACGRRSLGVALAVQAAGSVAVAVAGFAVLATGRGLGQGFGRGLTAGFALELRWGVDGLSGFFLGALGTVAVAALTFAHRYLPCTRSPRAVAALTALFLLVLAFVLCARDPFTFLLGWEAMSLVPAAVILVSRDADRPARRTVFTYLAITHLAGVATWVAVLLAARSGALDGSPPVTGSALQLVVASAALFGMGTKAGVMPLHVWLPRAHPMAPAPVSALMSGIMIKVALYGLVRVLIEWVGVLPAWFGMLVLAVGALSALGGVVYALFQHELKRLLALHSIENVGIILLGLGACLVLRARGDDGWAAVALGACLLHTLNHAVFKALLFLGAGAIERATGTLNLDRLGGLLRRMPWTGSCFAVAAMAIAGLPPLNGFASEWLTFRSLLRLPARGALADGVAGVLALAALAATAGLAVTCFVKVVGLVLLGPDRQRRPVQEAPVSMVAPMVALAAGCVVLGVVPGVLLRPLAALAPWTHPAAAEHLARYVPGGTGLPGGGPALALPGSGGLPAPGLTAVLVALTAALLLARGRRSAPPAPSWACGQQLGPELLWTSAGFTKPLRLVLEGVLRPRRRIAVRVHAGVVQEVRYTGSVPPLIDEHLYRPVARRSLAVAARVRRLQSGSLGTYVGYLIALVVGLVGLARSGVLR
ncbi:MAG TPA: proton-conducting transporter membrane subunit [Kineosporiaceae bacterium]